MRPFKGAKSKLLLTKLNRDKKKALKEKEI